MPQFVGVYNLGLNFENFGGVQAGPHLGPDLNGVAWTSVVGRHKGSVPDDFGSWVMGWSGSPFTTPPTYQFRIGASRGTLAINPVSNNLLFTLSDAEGASGLPSLYRINEADF